MANKLQLRRDTSTAWYNANPILSQGEPGFETDTGKLKIGKNNLSWRNLPYIKTVDFPSNDQGYLANDGNGNLSWLDIGQGIQSTQGIQGARGEATTVSYIFDGGNPSTNYSNGPAFNCGGVN
jgi:hypothetical protein